jgi:DeoR family transcriptional regulator, suf operon transcriptional repressor
MLVSARNTKEQILALLKQYGSLTIMELATELGITEMAVRRHIQTLERDKLIRSTVKKQTMGRPSKVYQLAENGENFFPKRYKDFSLDILQGLKDAGQGQLIIEILQKRKELLLNQYKIEHKTDVRLQDKVESLKHIQEHDGYMPEVEHKDGVIHFKELNCPYIEIAKLFPEVCQAEREFIGDFLEADLSTLSSIVDGHTCCHYKIKEK